MQSDFRLTTANVETLVRICQRLDGLPLALELAAVLVKTLSLAQIDAHLNDRFSLLTEGSRTAFPRQQTLQSMMDWSYALLSTEEQRLLRRLAIFADSFSLHAVKILGTHAEQASEDVLGILQGLVNKSLVVVVRGSSEVRYRLLDTIREYGQAKLFMQKEFEAVQGMHRDWCLQLAVQAQKEVYGAHSKHWLD